VSVLQNEKNEIEGNLGTMQARLLEEQKQKEEFATNYLILKQDFDTLKLELAEERKKWQSRQETDVNSQEQQKPVSIDETKKEIENANNLNVRRKRANEDENGQGRKITQKKTKTDIKLKNSKTQTSTEQSGLSSSPISTPPSGSTTISPPNPTNSGDSSLPLSSPQSNSSTSNSQQQDKDLKKIAGTGTAGSSKPRQGVRTSGIPESKKNFKQKTRNVGTKNKSGQNSESTSDPGSQNVD